MSAFCVASFDWRNYIPVSSNDLFLFFFFFMLYLFLAQNSMLLSKWMYRKSVCWILIENAKNKRWKKWETLVKLLVFSHQHTKWLNSIRSMNFGQFVLAHRSEITSLNCSESILNSQKNQVFGKMDLFSSRDAILVLNEKHKKAIL